MAERGLHMPSYYFGIAVALHLLKGAGEDTLRDELVREAGAEGLLRWARRAGEMRFTGLDRYVREKKEAERG